MDKFKNNTVIIGVVNPKGLPNGSKTMYFTEEQLVKAAKKMTDRRCKAIPVYIDHYTKTAKGEPIQPCGFVWYGKVREDNGKLYAVVVLHDNENGRIAKDMVNHPRYPMREFSLGYNVIMEEKNGVLTVKDTEVKEVTLCYKAVHNEASMSIITSVGEVLKASIPQNNLSNNSRNINKSNTTNKQKMDTSSDLIQPNQTIGNYYPSQTDYRREAGAGAINIEDADRELLNRFAIELHKESIPSANQYAIPAQASAADSGMAIPQTANPNGSTAQMIDRAALEAQISNLTRKENPQIDDLIAKLRKYDTTQGKSEISDSTTLTHMNDVKRRLISKYEEAKNGRKKQEQCATPEEWTLHSKVHALEDDQFNRELNDLDQRLSKMNTAIQTKLRATLPALMKVNEQSGNGLKQHDIEVLEHILSNAASMDQTTADSLVRYVEAAASFANDNSNTCNNAANTLNDLFSRYNKSEDTLIENRVLIDQLKKEIDTLKNENNTLKNSTTKPIQPIGNPNNGDNDTVLKRRKVEVCASSGASSSSYNRELPVFDPTSMNNFQQAALRASIINAPHEPAGSHLKRAAVWDAMMSNPLVKSHNIGEYQRDLFEKNKVHTRAPADFWIRGAPVW